MAERLDVAGRLAEGRAAMDHTQRYVLACQQIGYQHPDLTSGPAQIRDRYFSEDGLDLHSLDADCQHLRATDAVLAEALRLQRAQAAALAVAWEGPGAQSAMEFLQRHCDTATTLVAEVRAAAQGCEALRDNLWNLVDAKVATVVAIDDRTLPQRSAWLAAAAALAAGTGDRAAQQIVVEQVKPYVDNDIRSDWLNNMSSTRVGIAASFDMVNERLGAAPRSYFEIPGDLGPSGPLLPPAPSARWVSAGVASAGLPEGVPAPSGRVDAVGGQGSWTSPAPVSSGRPELGAPGGSPPNSALAQPDWGSALGNADGMSDGSSGLGSSGLGGGGMGGLGDLASRIVQAMGGLLGSAGEPPGDDDLLDETVDGPKELDEFQETAKPERAGQVDKVADAAMETTAPGDQAAPGTQPAPAGAPTVAGPPTAVSPATPPVAGPPVKAPVAGSTPCEIAANELPQAGQ